MVNSSKNFSKEELILLLEKGAALMKIVCGLILLFPEIEDTQENCVRRALFGSDDNIVLREETKIFSLKKNLIGTLKIN